MRCLLLILLLLKLSYPGFCQNPKIDSLRQVLNSNSNTYTEINCLSLLSREIYLLGMFDSSAYFAEKGLKLATEIDYSRGIASSSLNYGYACMNRGQFDTANFFFRQALFHYRKIADFKGVGASYNCLGNILLTRGDYNAASESYAIALKIRMKINDKQGIADCFNNFGIINFHQANYERSLKSYLAGLKILKEIGNQNGIARSYSNMGGIFLRQGDAQKALECYNKALEIQITLGDKMGMGRSYNNIASVYVYLNDYDKAMQEFQEALAIKEEIGDVMSLGQTYLNIGNIYYINIGQKQYSVSQQDSLMNMALEYYDKSLDFFELMGDRQSTAMAYNSIGTVYVSKGEPEKARSFLQTGLTLAIEVGSVNDMRLGYFGLAAADSASGNWESAYDHRKKSDALQDSMINAEQIRNTTEAQLNFEFEQAQIKQKAQQDKEREVYLEKIKWQKIIGFTLIATFILALLFVFSWFKRRRLEQENTFQQKLTAQQKDQASSIMLAQEQERKRIAEDLHDSLGQLLSTVKINLQTLPVEQQKYYVNSLQLLNQASAEIRNIAFNLMPQTLEDAGLIPALYELAEKIKNSSLYTVMVQVHGLEKNSFNRETEFNIYRIVQEAVNNIMKHADAKEINIQLIQLDETISIMIEDDGKGFDPLQLKMSGRGLRNITARSEWLHGNITIDSRPGKGTTIFIEIPKEKLTK